MWGGLHKRGQGIYGKSVCLLLNCAGNLKKKRLWNKKDDNRRLEYHLFHCLSKYIFQKIIVNSTYVAFSSLQNTFSCFINLIFTINWQSRFIPILKMNKLKHGVAFCKFWENVSQLLIMNAVNTNIEITICRFLKVYEF